MKYTKTTRRPTLQTVLERAERGNVNAMRLLSKAYLSKAKSLLDESNSIRYDLSYRKSTNYDGKDFSYSNLMGARFRGMSLSRANFTGTNLMNANMSDISNMDETNFTDAICINTSFIDTNLSNAIFNNTNLQYAAMRGADISGLDLRTAQNLEWKQLRQAKWSETSPPLLPSNLIKYLDNIE